MIRLQGLTKTYHTGAVEFTALQNVSLEIAAGEFVAIQGPSGSGKSTLLHLIGGLDHPTAGSIMVDKQPISELSDRALAAFRNTRVGLIFQAYHLLPYLTVYENVRLPLLYARRHLRGETRWIQDVIRAVGLGTKTARRPWELSGGEQQRVAIARALIHDPPLILADEPTGNLDSRTGEELFRLFEILHSVGKTIVLVTHDQKLARRASRILTLQDGHLI